MATRYIMLGPPIRWEIEYGASFTQQGNGRVGPVGYNIQYIYDKNSNPIYVPRLINPDGQEAQMDFTAVDGSCSIHIVTGWTCQDALAITGDSLSGVSVSHVRILRSGHLGMTGDDLTQVTDPAKFVTVPPYYYQCSAAASYGEAMYGITYPTQGGIETNPFANGSASVIRIGPVGGPDIQTTGFGPLGSRGTPFNYITYTSTESLDGRAGSIVGSLHIINPPDYLIERPAGGTAGGRFNGGFLTCVGLSDVGVDIVAARWPSGIPVAGLPYQVSANGTTFDDYSPPTSAVFGQGVTDADGRASFRTGPRPACNWNGAWTGGAGADHTIRANVDTTWLSTNGLNPARPYATAPLGPLCDQYTIVGPDYSLIETRAYPTRGYDRLGWWTYLRQPGVITATRATSYALDLTAAAPWHGTQIYFGNSLASNTPNTDWQITEVPGDGIHATLPVASVAQNYHYGIERTLSAAEGRAFRNFRYLRLRIRAAAAGVVTLRIQAGSYSYTDPFGHLQTVGGQTSLSRLSLNAGENSLLVDMAQADAPAAADASVQAVSPIGKWQLARLDVPLASDTTEWTAANAALLGLDALTPGAAYVVEEVSLIDLPSPDPVSGLTRTPVRAIGSTHPAAALEQPSGGFGGYNPPTTNLLRVLVHGRPCLSVPYRLPDPYGTPASPVTVTELTTADQLIARWREYFDGGSGCWSLTGDAAGLSASVPAVCLTPGAVSESALVLDGFVAGSSFHCDPGFELTVSPRIEVRFDLGGMAEGLTFDTATLRAGGGAALDSQNQNPPAGDPLAGPLATEETATADADGYFAFPDLFQPWYDPVIDEDPTTPAGYAHLVAFQALYNQVPVFPPHHIQSGKVPADVWVHPVPHRNASFIFAKAALLKGYGEQDIAQDYVTGRLFLVASDPITADLTCEARDGRQGLGGTPVRAKAAITDAAGNPRQGRFPSLWYTHETGLASLLYQSGDGAAAGQIVRADSTDGMVTLGAAGMALFSRTGGYPSHFRDSSSGILYAFAAFDNADGTQDVIAIRQNPQGALMTWADGTTERLVVAATKTAGRPVCLPNRYDAVQSLLLLHGDRRFSSSDGGESWTEVTT